MNVAVAKLAARQVVREAPAVAKSAALELPSVARQTASAGHQAAQFASVPVERRERSVGWAIVGYTLLAILVYILLKPRIVTALGGLVKSGTNALQTWVKPEDPIAALESALGSGNLSAASPSTAAFSRGGTPAGSSLGGAGPSSWSPHNAPSPSAAGNLEAARRRYGTINVPRGESLLQALQSRQSRRVAAPRRSSPGARSYTIRPPLRTP